MNQKHYCLNHLALLKLMNLMDMSEVRLKTSSCVLTSTLQYQAFRITLLFDDVT
jgi:hypothetical protein